MRNARNPPTAEEREGRAERLKERIYLTFTALAVLLALGAHGHVSAGEALRTLAVTVLGMLLAILVADVVSHMVVHERAMVPAEYRHALATSFGALGALVIPFVFLTLSAFGLWQIEGALRGAVVALVVALIVIGLSAIRRLRLRWWQRLIALGAEAVVGIAVIGLQILAHG
ncbi:MAG: hypothetical protein NT132_02850 [Microbacterium sp.]|uniref:hypothetical protein n=1 Tax=Microbacterium sp. TaxID=51671 RepID=UPI002636FD97|nr:hypothetical protein [Microbacterium sp.]MCX6501336.1 hypothetical protein [Microbacterium sp.]